MRLPLSESYCKIIEIKDMKTNQFTDSLLTV